MEREDKITTNRVETLKSELQRLSEDVVFMKPRPNGSGASTVATSTGSGGSTGNFAAHVMQDTFVAPSDRVERLGGLEEHPRNRDHDGQGLAPGQQC